MGKVYIVQEPLKRDQESGARVPLFDFSPAAVYGELTPLLGSNRSPLSPGPLVADVRSKLKNFNDADSILAVGDPVVIGIVVAVAAQVNDGRVAVLKWDRETRSYIRVAFNIQ